MRDNRNIEKTYRCYITVTILAAATLSVFALLWEVFPDKLFQILQGLSPDAQFEPRTTETIQAFPRIAFWAAVILGVPPIFLIIVAKTYRKHRELELSFSKDIFSSLWARNISIIIICVINVFLWHDTFNNFFSQDDFLFLERTRNTFRS